MKRIFSITLILFFLNLLVAPFVLYLSYPAYLSVSFFDVGQGDSIFIETPDKHQILIDGGPSEQGILKELSSAMPFWDKDIDLLILTHPESDHMTGLFEVLYNYKVDKILWTGIEKEGIKFEKWKRLVEEEGAAIYYANSGDRVIAGDVEMEVLNPENEIVGQTPKDTNDTSVVVKLSYNNSSFLFAGDISSKKEKDLLDYDISADVLKVAHHGSKYSSSEAFLGKVQPLIAVIQVGKNSYGHPTEEVLTRLRNFGIKVLRNDTNGDIKIISDGNNYKLITKE